MTNACKKAQRMKEKEEHIVKKTAANLGADELNQK